MGVHYKVVELTTVSDDEIEKTLNRYTGEGWHFESMHFAMRDASKRPSMAFLTFTKSQED